MGLLDNPDAKYLEKGRQRMLIVDESNAARELERFFVVAEMYSKAEKESAMMPVCLVDEVWHALLEDKDNYKAFCDNAVGTDVLHVEARGHGVLEWVNTYETLYGSLSEVWFCDNENKVNEVWRNEYLDTGLYYASWDCSPYFPDK